MITPFQQRVYDEVRKIPRGTVITYGELARRIGCGSARAVGQALRVNPFAPEVPCHRVLAADGSLAGFYGQCDAVALEKKRRLLESEGVRFAPNGRVERSARICDGGEGASLNFKGFSLCQRLADDRSAPLGLNITSRRRPRRRSEGEALFRFQKVCEDAQAQTGWQD